MMETAGIVEKEEMNTFELAMKRGRSQLRKLIAKFEQANQDMVRLR
ncbi:MAG: hypothetical protein K9I59_07350 [Chlorobium sp.]|nr:hypothetical protein [Chlorobium sp.]MCF8287858.1 hypothetical protein [Chlorobium sp.]